MTLAFVGIFCNLMVVSTIRDHDELQESTSNLLLANIALSNLIISFLVKPISAVYVAYSMTTGQGRVGLAFCTLYTMAYRTTWIVFPFTILALCWNYLRLSLSMSLICPAHCNVTSTLFPCWQQRPEAEDGEEDLTQADSQLAAEWEEMQRARLFPTIKQKSILSAIWLVSALYGLTFCYQDKVNKLSSSHH